MIINNRIRFSHLWRIIKNKIPFVNVSKTRYHIGKTDISVNKFENKLIGASYQYNYFSYTEKGQISNMRRLYIEIVNGYEEIRQVHVRLFDDGSIYAHDELAYEYDALGHVKAKTLKRINTVDEQELVKILNIKV